MAKTKYTLEQIMTIPEAAERFGINVQTLKNKMKPSVVGQDRIDEWVTNGLIRQSSKTWLITVEFIENNFKNI